MKLTQILPDQAADNLRQAGIVTLQDALDKGPAQLMRYRGVGPGALTKIREAAKQAGHAHIPPHWDHTQPAGDHAVEIETAITELELARNTLDSTRRRITAALTILRKTHKQL